MYFRTFEFGYGDYDAQNALHCESLPVLAPVIQYAFQIKNLSKDTPSFQRQDWLKSERANEVE